MATLHLVPDADEPMALTPGLARGRRETGRDEQRMARGLVAGDPEALREIHAAHAGTVVGYLLGVLRDRGTAEDVCQQVVTDVWTRGRSYDRAPLLTWTTTIARSRAIDELRRRRPEPRAPETAAALADAHLLRLRFYEELSQTEIAERAGLALGTVKTRMVRGLERLRDLMAAQDERDARTMARLRVAS